ncbi:MULTISPECIES: cytochrome-c oxidase, cbb3-type subunit I [Brucella/Ochrobactrum group]|jgi:cytochrome c oxidase cbb3-type subunit 1|uniref:cytochrome-c oxidase n=1 Tax=Brucella pseudintermedia TaxID=370111 RepID=A0ABY5U9R7_9HYPH|nr:MULTISPECIES: cytochrome-c oxidase, cbb3-type subunit I [Brucella/Ochrobactrum group]KAB2682147.1 cytochrome-c oxidase, cbb3-type subunit I [Brucella pseudintermedia]NKE75779.1 cytochrome-c oxidase, cbb3-type subunit I [Ochrobactrum sp. MC-1LL]TWH02159.1 cytochrome c oxidase cbb3-type subunit 1 [Ochrobactrum sp. J50]UWL60088.1 cytochrome-c oxidase, cbb3-type subunit I [Brucella pseudintermedia]WPM80508.1 cytochrome-c oxidase, cbb3-type subunit I [Brucella pseudintermedia]
MNYAAGTVLSGLGALFAVLLAGFSHDELFRTHMWILFATLAIFTILLMRNADYGLTPKKVDTSTYMDGPIRYGVIATVFWGVVGFLVGVVIAAQLAFPDLNLEPYLNFGRLRPLHTSAVIFAFGGNALICSSFYVVQRTCRARLIGGDLAWFVFWGYQLFIVMAATGYLLGITQSREYAEPEWYVDIWLTIVWVAYLVVFLGTILKRKEPHIYVANWFYLSFIITIAMLHIVNNLAIPVSFLGVKSYSAFAGVQDAVTQWWYGHNAVAFFLTVPFLAMMYYFVPKQAERPIYSYRLSIVHFWSIIFLYIWAGPHHLHYTAVPDWAQTLGMVFSIMLWMPSWGGMINGLMTLSGAWDKVRTDPIIRLMVAAIAFYGMATFEGPMLSIKAVNSLSHYTDWTIGHVHAGALGWNGMISFAAVYYLAPKLWNRQRLYSIRMVNWHFWLATLGIVLYAAAMWVAGIQQGLMWREYDDQGFLVYSFAETVLAMFPYYVIRTLGGVLYLAGGFVMAWNVYQTIRGNLRNEAPMGGTRTVAGAAMQPAE